MRVIADKRNETDGRDMEFLWRQDMDGMRQCSNDTHSIGWIWWFRNGRWIGEHQLSHLYMSHDVASDNNKYDKELLAFGWSIGSISVWYSDFRHSLIITKEWSIAHNKQTKLCLFVFRKKKNAKNNQYYPLFYDSCSIDESLTGMRTKRRECLCLHKWLFHI